MKNMIIFGASNLGKIAYEKLNDSYNIIGFLDNDRSKWGKEICGRKIMFLDQLKSIREVEIVIASMYYDEIAIQLVNMGINKFCIFKYKFETREHKIEEVNYYEDPRKSKSLILEKSNLKKGKKKSNILIVCSFFSFYINEYVNRLSKYEGIEFDILTSDKEYYNRIKEFNINNIYYYANVIELKNIINCLEKYDFIHIHFLNPIYSEILNEIKSKCARLIISIWGSDLYKTSDSDKKTQKLVIEKSDIVTFDNETIKKEFLKVFKGNYRTEIASWGVSNFEYLNSDRDDVKSIKNRLKISDYKIVIECGYNANKSQNHLKIIEELNKLDENTKNKLFLIFPMTYGRDIEYVNLVKNKLKEIGIDYLTLDELVSTKEICNITSICDIMLNLQNTDCLCATMLEHMFNGNMVIAGSWLFYDILKEKEIYFKYIDKFGELNTTIEQVMRNLSDVKAKCSENKQVIFNNYSWQSTIGSWLNLYKN